MTWRAPVPAVVVAGHTMALAVVRALGESGVPVVVLHYDRRDFAQASRHVVAAIRVPDPLTEEAAFVEAVVARAGELGGSVLFPVSDESIVAVARNRARLADLYRVACPDWPVVRQVIDKSLTYEVAAASGVRVPRTVTPADEAGALAAAGEIGYPVLLKPSEGHRFYAAFRRKMVLAGDEGALAAAYRRSADAGLAVMVQELIPGADSDVVNYNAYVAGGRPLVEFTARQLRKAPPVLGSPRVAVAERVPEVIEPGRATLAALGFEGFACTELKRDARTGEYVLMEVNGRHNLSGLLAVRAGVNFPLLHYRHLAEGVEPSPVAWRPGLYWTDLFRDAGYSVVNLRRERLGPRAYLVPYARRHCDAIVERGDLGPAAARLRYLATNLLATLRASTAS